MLTIVFLGALLGAASAWPAQAAPSSIGDDIGATVTDSGVINRAAGNALGGAFGTAGAGARSAFALAGDANAKIGGPASLNDAVSSASDTAFGTSGGSTGIGGDLAANIRGSDQYNRAVGNAVGNAFGALPGLGGS
ncbi:hypothetical protein IPZ58_28165 [Streptomyces roseoverticillatus]|nr:hypothetical protein [Streptomyces roseoverticillatus]